MSITKNYQYDGSLLSFIGISTDSKPAAAPPGSLFLEVDSRRQYIMSSTNYWTLLQKYPTTGSGI